MYAQKKLKFRFIYLIIMLLLKEKVKSEETLESIAKHIQARACISSDAEFEAVYRYLNNSAPEKLGIEKWNWNGTRNIIKKCSDNNEKLSVKLTQDGFLVVHNDSYYPTEDFCVDEKDKSAKICDLNKTMLIKCCPEDEIWDLETQDCMKTPIAYRPKFNFVANSTTDEKYLPFRILDRNYSSKNPLTCPEGFELKFFLEEPCSNMNPNKHLIALGLFGDGARNISFDLDPSLLVDTDCNHPDHKSYKSKSTCRFQLGQDGIRYESTSGLFHRKSQWKHLTHDFYCVDGYFTNPLCHYVNPSMDNPNIQEKCADSLKNIFIFCEPSGTLISEEKEQSPVIAYCLASIWMSTCPLLLSAAVANLLVIQKNVHDWTLSCYLMSMFFVNINSAILALENRAFGCRVIDFSMKFLYLSTLCWMTSINFGLWRTFRSVIPRPIVEPHRFILNLLFSTGVPATVVTIAYFAAKGDSCNNQYCALYSHETLPYYSGPVIFFILVNLILFIRTSLIIAGLRHETSSVLNKELTKEPNGGQVESFRLFTKLFLMTGSIWIVRVALLFLQLKNMYDTWYGVTLEAVFSVPEAAFSIMVLLHPEFRKWAWEKYPSLSRKLSGILCCFKYTPSNSLELGTKSHSTNNTIINRSPTTSTR